MDTSYTVICSAGWSPVRIIGSIMACAMTPTPMKPILSKTAGAMVFVDVFMDRRADRKDDCNANVEVRRNVAEDMMNDLAGVRLTSTMLWVLLIVYVFGLMLLVLAHAIEVSA